MTHSMAELRKIVKSRREMQPRGWSAPREKFFEFLLLVSAISSVGITLGIVGILLWESSTFFSHVSIVEFITDTEWTPRFEPAHFGILPLLCGTLMTTVIAMLVAIPLGSIAAIYLSEFASKGVRETVKPLLELLSAIPTVIYGYFALMVIAPGLQAIVPDLPRESALTAGIVMGIMIIPYVSSLSEEAMRAVPMLLREGSYALGANRIRTAIRVVYPAAISGIGAAYILGLSRAIGETMIVAVAGGMQPTLSADPRSPAQTVTAYIVNTVGGDASHGSIPYQSIFAAGLALFVMTLFFNLVGHYLKTRYRESY